MSLEDKKELDVDTVKVVPQGNTEYDEYLALSQEFEGERLRRLTRKLDLRVLPQLIVIYLLSYIDRANVGNARLFSAQQDLKMTGTQWNIALSVFFITYALAGPFCNILTKRFGPKRVIPLCLLGVGVVLVSAGVSNKYEQWLAMRLMLGIFEAGIFPGCAYTLTTWYTPAQIHSRTTIFYSGASIAGAFSGLLAYGIGHLDGTLGYHGWRWIYCIEGVFTVIVALVACFILHDVPGKVRFLTEDERRFLILRNEFEYGGKGTNSAGAHNEFNWADVLVSLRSWHVYVLSFSYFCIAVGVYGMSFSLPTIVKNMGFTATNAQLLSAPPYIVAFVCVITSGFYSDKTRKRMWSMVVPSTAGWIGLLICVLTVTHKKLVPLSYIAVCLATGGLYSLSSTVTVWIGLNQAPQTKRAVSVAVTLLFSQFGGLVGSNIYLANEAPAYPTGFGCSLALLGAGCIVTPLVYWWLIGRINTRRAAMSEEEVYAKYTVEELQTLGDRSPLYRYER